MNYEIALDKRYNRLPQALRLWLDAQSYSESTKEQIIILLDSTNDANPWMIQYLTQHPMLLDQLVENFIETITRGA